MYKRKDNDIFGTDSIGFAPRIENCSFVDPNAAFRKKMDDNYDRYANKVTNTPISITSKHLDHSRVNEKAQFQDNYHKFRKQADMQSSIFYEPTVRPVTAVSTENNRGSLANSNVFSEVGHGRRQTMKREINSLPFNDHAIKGNSSRLFDMDERIRPKTEEHIPLAPLIPCQMQWDQHDSVRYAHINDLTKSPESKRPLTQNFQNIEESQSGLFNQEDLVAKVDKKYIVEKKEEVNKLKKAKSQKDIKKVETLPKGKEPVEIKILKGWDYKLMETLSKQCKLCGSAIMRFQVEEGGKATLVLKRSERWQNVTDWLRKDAKLRIRVINN